MFTVQTAGGQSIRNSTTRSVTRGTYYNCAASDQFRFHWVQRWV